MAYGFTRTLPTITGSHVDFPVLLTEGSFPTAAVDGGANSVLNGGGNLRAYTDDTKTTQLPLEVVSFVTGGTPSAQVWVKIPTAATGNTIYLEADGVATTQPAVTDTYGRNAVWSDYAAVLHCNEASTNGVFTDSTGNSHDTTLTTGATLATTTAGHPFGGSWPDFTANEALTLATSGDTLNDSAMTISAWVNMDSASTIKGLIGNRYQSNDTQWFQIIESGRAFAKGAVAEDFAGGSITTAVTQYYTATHDSSSLDAIINGSLIATDVTISNTAGINAPVDRNYRIGTYYENAASRLINGRVGEVRLRKLKTSVSLQATEYDNQNTPATWGTSSAWADSGGAGETLTLESGSYTLSGTAVALRASFNTAIESGSYTLTGSDVNLIYTPVGTGYTLAIDSGSYTLTGSPVGLFATRNIKIDNGSYSLTGSDVNLSAAFNTLIESGSYTLTGSPVSTSFTGNMTIESGSYIMTGTDVIFRSTGNVWADKSIASTVWANNAKITTSWGDKSPTTTTWTDK